MKVYKRSAFWNGLLGFAAVMFLALGVTTLKEYLAYAEYSRIALVSAPGIIFGLLAMISIIKFRIIVADDYIERVGFAKIRIKFEEINEFEYLYDSARIKAGDRIIRITKDLKNKNELIDLVYNRIKDNPDVKIIK